MSDLTDDQLELLKNGALSGEKLREQMGARKEPMVLDEAPPSLFRTRRCQRCAQIYDEKQPRTPAEIERLQQTLFITGPGCHVELAFCDSCYEQVVETPTRRNNSSSFDNGSSNIGPGNWLLQQKYGK